MSDRNVSQGAASEMHPTGVRSTDSQAGRLADRLHSEHQEQPHEYAKLLRQITTDGSQGHQQSAGVEHDAKGNVTHIDFSKTEIYPRAQAGDPHAPPEHPGASPEHPGSASKDSNDKPEKKAEGKGDATKPQKKSGAPSAPEEEAEDPSILEKQARLLEIASANAGLIGSLPADQQGAASSRLASVAGDIGASAGIRAELAATAATMRNSS